MPKPYFNSKCSYNIAEILRVNHAGETAAQIIYAMQLKNLSKSDIATTLKEMHDQELQHLAFYSEYLKKYNVSPSFMLPLWRVLSAALGFATSFTPTLAMICTKAVEEVIDEHYKEQHDQIKDLDSCDQLLLSKISEHLADEIHHKQIAIDYLGPFQYPCTELFIKLSCKLAIYISKKI